MRHVVSIAVFALLLVGSIPAVSVTAQDRSLLDLLPTAGDVGPGFVVVDNRPRTLAEQATGFANADEAARLLADWDWRENAFAVFQAAALTPSGAPVATLDISLTRFADAGGAATALPYFLQDRAAVLGQREIQNLSQNPLGDETRVLAGAVEGDDDTTLYVRSGALLMRISLTTTSSSGGPAISPEEIAQGIIDQTAPPSPSATVLQATGEWGSLSDTLPLDYAACFSIEGEGELDAAAAVERLASGADAAITLESLGWQGGAYRQFACDPPPGRVGWVDLSLHRFPDARAAADAVALFAASRARGMDLRPAAVNDLGESAAALAGPAVNGTEYTLYVSNGPLLFAVTGVAPASTSDPRADVEAIAAALLAPNASLLEEESPTATPLAPVAIPPTVAPIPTSTPLPTPLPIPSATPTPVPTATPVPMLVALPTATAMPAAPPPPPTATTIPTPIPTALPTAMPPRPTATTGVLPSPTPRVIRPPTPVAG